MIKSTQSGRAVRRIRERERERKDIRSQRSVKLSGFDVAEFVFIVFVAEFSVKVCLNDEQLSGPGGSVLLVRLSSSCRSSW